MTKNEAIKIAVQDIIYVMRDAIEHYDEDTNKDIEKLVALKTNAIRVLMRMLDEKSVDGEQF